MLPRFAPGPYVGRVCHFYTKGPKNNGPHAAIITRIWADIISITVFGGSGTIVAPQSAQRWVSPQQAQADGGVTWLPHEERQRHEEENFGRR